MQLGSKWTVDEDPYLVPF